MLGGEDCGGVEYGYYFSPAAADIFGDTLTACIGLCPKTGQPREVFLNGGKEGSQFDAMLADAATVISVALQYGVPVAALAM